GQDSTSHQGFPVLEAGSRRIVGVVTRRNLLDPKLPGEMRVAELIKRPPIVIYDDCTLRDAADHMVNHDIGRLPVVSRLNRGRVIGMMTRSDLLKAHRHRLESLHRAEQSIRLRPTWRAPAPVT